MAESMGHPASDALLPSVVGRSAAAAPFAPRRTDSPSPPHPHPGPAPGSPPTSGPPAPSGGVGGARAMTSTVDPLLYVGRGGQNMLHASDPLLYFLFPGVDEEDFAACSSRFQCSR